MFDQFTDNARKTMALANQEAQRLRHEYIGVNHVALGILANKGCMAWTMLASLDVNMYKLKSRIEGLDMRPAGSTPMAKRTIEEAIAEAREHGEDYVGTEHLLLGLVRARSPQLQPVLEEFGVELSKVRECLRELRGGMTTTIEAPAFSRAPEPVGAYPGARRVGNLLFLSGQGPRQRGSKDIPGVVLGADGQMVSYDVAAQVRAVFQNVRWVLEEHGSSFDRIVDVTCFLTNLEKDFPAYNRAYAELFPSGPNQPCRTTIGISALPQGGSAPIAFEAKVVATVG